MHDFISDILEKKLAKNYVATNHRCLVSKRKQNTCTLEYFGQLP